MAYIKVSGVNGQVMPMFIADITENFFSATEYRKEAKEFSGKEAKRLVRKFNKKHPKYKFSVKEEMK